MTSSNERNASNNFLVDYFIYCPLLGAKEGQEDRKILYYHPNTVDIDQQIRRIGYCEGLVKFSETFAFDDPCETVHFQKTRFVFYNVENNICLAMTLRIPTVERRKDEKISIDYLDEQINDRLILPLLRMSYRYFVFQQGLISVILQHEGIEKLKIVLTEHFDPFIQYHFNSMINNASIDSTFFGTDFLFIDKPLYLKIQSILRRLELTFLSCKETFFLYKDQIIWSGLGQDDTTLFYSFFRLYYWPHIQLFPNPSMIRYLTVNTSAIPAEQLKISTDLTSQDFFLGDSFIPHRIIVINFNFFTMFCIFEFDEYLPANEKLSARMEILQKDLDPILADFEGFLRRKHPTVDPTVKNLFLDRLNMAQATSIDWSREPHTYNNAIINALAEDLQWLHPAGEVLVKREHDPWIVAKRSDMRELFITINQKNANLKEISDKIKQIFSVQFNNILILE